MNKNFIKTFFDNIKVSFFAVKFVFSVNKAYLFVVFFNELIIAGKVLPYMFLLKKGVALLTEGAAFELYISNVLPILLLMLSLEIITAALSRIREGQKEKLHFRIKELIIEKNDKTDYYALSTKEYYMLQSKAYEAYSQGCVDKNISLLFSTISNVVVLLGIILTITTLGMVIVLPIVVTVIVRILSEYFDRKAYYIRTTQLAEIGRKCNYLHQICENIQFAKEIRTFDLKDKFDHKLEEISEEKVKIWKKYVGIFRYSSATYDIADIGLQLFIYLTLAYRIIVLKTLAIDDFVYIFTACQQIQSTVGNIALNSMNIFMNSDYLSDFMKYWEYSDDSEHSSEEEEKISVCDFSEFIIEFKNVSFQYPNTEFMALDKVNVTLKRGNTYLIVGKNGAGKSTFVKLLCRLYKPTSGVITLNGIDIHDYDKGVYFEAISALFQDYKTLNLSIKDNILSMGEEMDEDSFQQAMLGADIYKKISSLPNMAHTSYSKIFDENGIEFSGGEAQKMMIAKALYKESHIRIFDEPTSGVDAIAEEKIYNYIQNTSHNCLTIYITHKLSTGVKCDNILVFDKGTISEMGNHLELMEKNSIYAGLFSSQAKLYVED